MRLNNELVRELMLYIEENCDFNNIVQSSNILIPESTNEEIIYTLLRLSEAGYINCATPSFDDNILVIVYSLTWNGHQFLDNIRDDGVWHETKLIASKFKSISINILSQIASSVILKMIT